MAVLGDRDDQVGFESFDSETLRFFEQRHPVRVPKQAGLKMRRHAVRKLPRHRRIGGKGGRLGKRLLYQTGIGGMPIGKLTEPPVHQDRIVGIFPADPTGAAAIIVLMLLVRRRGGGIYTLASPNGIAEFRRGPDHSDRTLPGVRPGASQKSWPATPEPDFANTCTTFAAYDAVKPDPDKPRPESGNPLKAKNFTTWLKRTLIAVALLLVVAILFTALGYRKLHGVPDWYALRTMSAEKLAAAAHSAENKLAEMQNWAAEQRARESARLHAATASSTTSVAATRPAATKPADATTIEFSQDELNAFFQKWVASAGWADKFGKYVADPAIFLQNGRVILAGTVKELGGAVASAHFEPTIDANGMLDLRLVRVLGGNLPLPKAVWASQRDRLAQVAAQQLPRWQQHAAMTGNGTVNIDAVSAGLTEALLHVLHDEPAEPVIFLPVAGHGAVPARLTDVSVQDQTLSLTVRPMTPAERAAFLARVKGDGARHAPQTALAR